MTASTLGYTPGSGASVATDLEGGAHHQKAVVEYLTAAGGVPTPVTELAPMPIAAYGELIEAMEALRFAVQALTRSGIGQSLPDTAGRLRVLAESTSAANFLVTVTLANNQTLTNVTTLAQLTNQTQVGGFSATEQIPSLMRLGADCLRRNISVT